jgi:hypothetical protein
MASGCIFCGTSPTTNAHIFRKGWIEQVYPGAEGFGHRHQRHGEGGFDVHRVTPQIDFKVNRVCESCNGGWMDRLDHAAEDLFAHAAATVAANLRIDKHADKELLARWCLLIGVLFDQMQANPVVSKRVHRELYEDRMPDNVFVWLLRTDPPEWEVTGFGEPSELREVATNAPHAYLVSFGVKHLVAQVYVADDAMPAMSFDRSQNASILRQLWPAPMTPFIWPPPLAFKWEERDRLNKMFNAIPPEETP